MHQGNSYGKQYRELSYLFSYLNECEIDIHGTVFFTYSHNIEKIKSINKVLLIYANIQLLPNSLHKKPKIRNNLK